MTYQSPPTGCDVIGIPAGVVLTSLHNLPAVVTCSQVCVCSCELALLLTRQSALTFATHIAEGSPRGIW